MCANHFDQLITKLVTSFSGLLDNPINLTSDVSHHLFYIFSTKLFVSLSFKHEQSFTVDVFILQ